MFLPMRIRHQIRARKKRKARAKAFVSVRSELEDAVRLNSENVKIVFNVGLYVLFLDQDLADFADDLVFSTDERKRSFVAKHEAILLYEAAQDIPQLLGQQFRAAAKSLGASEGQIALLNAVSSDLNGFWQKHREFLGTVRNALAAHREHDALHYWELLEFLDALEVAERAAELSELLGRLVSVLTELALLTANPVLILKEVIASRKARASR